MTTYAIVATATLQATSDEAAQNILDALARLLASGEYGYDWQIEANPIPPDPVAKDQPKHCLAGRYLGKDGKLRYSADGTEVFPGPTGVRRP